MHSDRLTKLEQQRTQRKTALRHLATSLGPAWVGRSSAASAASAAIGTSHSSLNGSSSAGTRTRHVSVILGKRTRKAVDRYNPTKMAATTPRRHATHAASHTATTTTRSGKQTGGVGSRGRGRGRRRSFSSRNAFNTTTTATTTTTTTTSTHPRFRLDNGRSPEERAHDQQLNQAAHASRLHAHGLSLQEFDLFQYHLGRSDLESYLKVRNTMLWMWRESPRQPLTLIKAFQATKNFGLHHGLIAHVFEFLLRTGYINFGACAHHDENLDRDRDLDQEEDQDDVVDSLRRDRKTAEEGGGHATKIADTSPSPSEEDRKTIVVVGSGIAGVAAAKQLENLFRYYTWRFAPELPPKVVVLEARPRVGGRMHSQELYTKSTAADISSTPAASAPAPTGKAHQRKRSIKHAVDLGAQIITGFENGNPMEIIVRRQLLDLKLHYLENESCDLFDHDGKMVSKNMDVHCEAAFNQILDRACQLRQKDELPESLVTYLKERRKKDGKGLGSGRIQTASTIWPTLGHSMDFFMESHPEFRTWTPKELELIHWHYANLEFANATPLDYLSLRHWDQDDDYEFSGSHSMVVQGYGQVPLELSKGLDVRLNTPVSSIKRQSPIPGSSAKSAPHNSNNNVKRHLHHREPIEIQCRNGTSIQCSACVITVPLGVLKAQQIKFSPPLPTWKEQAIQRLGFGLLNKLVLVFEKCFWDEKIELFGYAGSGKKGFSSGVSASPSSSSPSATAGKELDMKAYRSSRGKFYMFWNCAVVSGLPVLVTLMAGQSAYDCESIPKEELVQEALETLGLIYPQIRPMPRPVETIVTCWSQDEFTRGSYSFVGKEATGEDYDLLSKPVDGQLYFAGEATSRHYPATAHGAYLSGIRVAKEILDHLIGPQVVNSGNQGKERDKGKDKDQKKKMEVDEEQQKQQTDREYKGHGPSSNSSRYGKGDRGTTHHNSPTTGPPALPRTAGRPRKSVSTSASITSASTITTNNTSASVSSSSRSSSPESHLMTMEDAHTSAYSPSPHPEVIPSLMSLGHGFVIPRRRGRVSRSLIAKFVAERSSDEEDEDEDEDEGKGKGHDEGEDEEDEEDEGEDSDDDSEMLLSDDE